MNATTFDLDLTLRRELPAAAAGDHAAYGRIVGACQNTITAVAWAITRDVQASEDIAQETFISAWKHLGRLKQPDSFLPWIRQITRNLARNHLRSARHRPLNGEQAELAIELAADTAPTPDERLLQTEEETVAAEVIAALPEDARETLLLFYREGQRSQQVASLLGLTDAAVRKRLSRARSAVREELLARFGDFARSSAPAAGFATVVTAALTLASPPAAAATLLGVTGAAGGKTLAQVLLGSLGSVGVGISGAAIGIWWGLQRSLRGAIDERERRELKRAAAINATASVMFVVLITTYGIWGSGWIFPVALAAVFFGVIFWQSAIVEPRIKARRHAQEAMRDPATAAKARRRERVLCWIGCATGLLCGGGGLLYALISTGRLPL
ncbi:MAG: sigma-70 family RNA polymerase sigma factor [Pseudoxanthomonas sp.]